MNILITLLSVLVVLLSLIFSYNVRDYSFDIFEDVGLVTKYSEEIEIVDMPIVFDAQRKYLTALYREKHTADCDHRTDGIDACVLIEPMIIVLHMTDIDSLERSFEFMRQPVLREERERLMSRSYDRVNVSAHYLIDKDGTIYSLMPDNYMGRHAMGVNHSSIGIENVGTNTRPPTPEQIEANVKLVEYLMKKYDISPHNVYSHAETAGLRDKGPPIFIEKDENYLVQRHCGEKLIKEVRKRLRYNER